MKKQLFSTLCVFALLASCGTQAMLFPKAGALLLPKNRAVQTILARWTTTTHSSAQQHRHDNAAHELESLGQQWIARKKYQTLAAVVGGCGVSTLMIPHNSILFVCGIYFSVMMGYAHIADIKDSSESRLMAYNKIANSLAGKRSEIGEDQFNKEKEQLLSSAINEDPNSEWGKKYRDKTIEYLSMPEEDSQTPTRNTP